MSFGLDFVNQLKPCKWRYIGPLDDGVEHFGFIAQEVDAIASHKEYGFVLLGSDGMFKISPGEFIGPLARAVQELSQQVALLKEDVKELYELRNAKDCKLEHDQAGGHDPMGDRHDLQENLGDL